MSLPSGSHPLAGKTVKLNSKARDPQRDLVKAGAEFHVEDYWHSVGGQSWMYARGNWATVHYGMRAGLTGLPKDDNVVYGKIDGLGHIVHVSELGDVVS